LVRSDDENNPNVGLTEARRLVKNENVIAILGNLSSAMSIANQSIHRATPDTVCNQWHCHRVDQKQEVPFTFRSSFASGQVELPLAYYLYTRGYRKGVLMGSDYSAGHDAVATLGECFTRLGGTVLEQIFPRAGETDYGPFRSRVAEAAVWISCSAISSEGIRSGSFASKNSMLVIANHYHLGHISRRRPCSASFISALCCLRARALFSSAKQLSIPSTMACLLKIKLANARKMRSPER
jgi:Periplasmic binding protein